MQHSAAATAPSAWWPRGPGTPGCSIGDRRIDLGVPAGDPFPVGGVRGLQLGGHRIHERCVVCRAEHFLGLVRPAFAVLLAILALEPADTLLRVAGLQHLFAGIDARSGASRVAAAGHGEQ